MVMRTNTENVSAVRLVCLHSINFKNKKYYTQAKRKMSVGLRMNIHNVMIYPFQTFKKQ